MHPDNIKKKIIFICFFSVLIFVSGCKQVTQFATKFEGTWENKYKTDSENTVSTFMFVGNTVRYQVDSTASGSSVRTIGTGTFTYNIDTISIRWITYTTADVSVMPRPNNPEPFEYKLTGNFLEINMGQNPWIKFKRI